MLDPRSLEIFSWVVRPGGFGRAAERLHATQPAVSARIAALEAHFGARLVERGAGGDDRRAQRPALRRRDRLRGAPGDLAVGAEAAEAVARLAVAASSPVPMPPDPVS